MDEEIDEADLDEEIDEADLHATIFRDGSIEIREGEEIVAFIEPLKPTDSELEPDGSTS